MAKGQCDSSRIRDREYYLHLLWLAKNVRLNHHAAQPQPDERRDKVIKEVNRPTFTRRNPPMNRICSYISFSTLRQNIERVAGMSRYLKPEFLQELAEPCVPDE